MFKYFLSLIFNRQVNNIQINNLPDEVMLIILNYCGLESLKNLALTNKRNYHLITKGEVKGVNLSTAVSYHFSFFAKLLTWDLMSRNFHTKSIKQWNEVQQLIEADVLDPQQLIFTQPAINIKEFNDIEILLNKANMDYIELYIEENLEELVYEKLLDLSSCSLTRFPLKQFLENSKYSALLLELKKLDLSYNKLNGSIPLELCQLINLEHLRLSNNRFKNAIPSEITQLKELRILTLNNNRLSGSIPSEIGQLNNLIYLSVGKNKLSGTIPSRLESLNNLLALSMFDNELTGSIPSELHNLDNLESIVLEDNKLQGPVPFNLARRFPHLVNSEGHIANQFLDTSKDNRRRP